MDKDLNILIINGPNLNMLGVREPEQYGSKSYKDIEMELHEYSFELGVNIEIFQSNFEGEIVEKIQYALGNLQKKTRCDKIKRKRWCMKCVNMKQYGRFLICVRVIR